MSRSTIEEEEKAMTRKMPLRSFRELHPYKSSALLLAIACTAIALMLVHFNIIHVRGTEDVFSRLFIIVVSFNFGVLLGDHCDEAG